MLTISPSEVDSFRSCQRKHWYAFGFPIKSDRGLAPKSHSKSLQRGTDGHSILGDYYKMRIDGFAHMDSARHSLDQAAKELVNRITTSDTLGQETMSEAIDIVTRYFEFFGDEYKTWQPLAAEKEFRIQISSDVVMAFKPDGIFRNMENGRLSIWDHKFLYNLYKQEAVGIMPQLLKYTAALRRLGYKIEDGKYNILSTRKNAKKNVFVRTPKPLKENAINGFWEEQRRASIEIALLKADPVRWAQAPRSASYFNCKNCAFLMLCTAELEEQEGVKYMVEGFYRVNDYRYDNLESIEE